MSSGGKSYGAGAAISVLLTSNSPSALESSKISSVADSIPDAVRGSMVFNEGFEAIKETNLVYTSSTASASPPRKDASMSWEISEASAPVGA
eukprot:CAMPEP_0117740958 /NCGR_PEP_ID=MMETSP0947-20121206/4636_1 /TAXON_ID=44440 /ORGANISM="Chattonella subsalsa, Strain CCMP2191" /LENGTH=91 /DNA_ID=CAMNT_0005557141 /DNA_START=59 /DNA_END=334 /DNA_ORIENTATION=+